MFDFNLDELNKEEENEPAFPVVITNQQPKNNQTDRGVLSQTPRDVSINKRQSNQIVGKNHSPQQSNAKPSAGMASHTTSQSPGNSFPNIESVSYGVPSSVIGSTISTDVTKTIANTEEVTVWGTLTLIHPLITLTDKQAEKYRLDKVIRLYGDIFTIGKKKELNNAAIFFDDLTQSFSRKEHITIERKNNSTFVITENPKSCGIFLNGIKIKSAYIK